jgi:NAD(P)H dehydrogenase (quinone)
MSTLLVSGASGQLGRRVVELLLDAGDHTVIAATRDPSKVADLAARGAIVRALDFDAPDPAAFAGVDRALIISVDDLQGRLARHLAAIAAAADVDHLVYTSIVQPTSPRLTVGPDHAGTEAALHARSGGFTILRNNLYAELLLGAVSAAIGSGQLVTARGEGRIAYVSREDCARAAAAALRDGFTGRRKLDITGPRAISGDELAAAASALSGRPVAHVSVPVDAFTAGLVAHAGLPQPIAELLAAFELAAAAGDLAGVSDAARELTGRGPIDPVAFLAAAGVGRPA